MPHKKEHLSDDPSGSDVDLGIEDEDDRQGKVEGHDCRVNLVSGGLRHLWPKQLKL